jgi:uncharacterized protein (TIGR00730 family)
MVVAESSDERRVDQMAPARTPKYRTGNADIDAAIDALVALLPSGRSPDVLAELLAGCCGLVLDDSERGDLKLASAAIRDMRSAFFAFTPYRSIRKVTVFGSARTRENDALYETAVSLSRSFAERDWMVVTGAGPGIMTACVEGAGPEASLGVAISLPWENEPTQLFGGDDPKLVFARQFFTRKLGLVKDSHAFVCMPGGFGTLDEMFEVLTLFTRGKGQIAPIYLLEAHDTDYWRPLLQFFDESVASRGYIDRGEIAVLRHTTEIEAVVHGATAFYSNYDSMRYVGRDLLLRVRFPPSETLLEAIRTTFSDILRTDRVEVLHEHGRGGLLFGDLYGIRFEFDRHSFARLYELVDRINEERSSSAE